MGALMAMMPAISVIDIRHRIIPNRLMYPSLVAFPVADRCGLGHARRNGSASGRCWAASCSAAACSSWRS